MKNIWIKLEIKKNMFWKKFWKDKWNRLFLQRCLKMTDMNNPLFLLSLTDLDILKQSKVTGHEIKITKNLALENFYRQEMLKEYSTSHLLE